MVGSSKILTVSYGTFSCTLEGFDDSFDTMKAIAEYFRDLAADDRYFGAEPPTPDAEMLARIAEREISRRVEAHEHQGRIVLRAQDAAALAGVPAAKAPTAAPEVEREAPEAPGVGKSDPAEARPPAGVEAGIETSGPTDDQPETTDAEQAAPSVAVQGPDMPEPPVIETAEVGTAEVGTAEVETDEVGTAEVETGDVGTAEVETGEVGTAEVETDEVETGEVTTGEAGETTVEELAQEPEQQSWQDRTEAVAPAEDDSLAARLNLIRSVVGGGDQYNEDEHAQNFLAPDDALDGGFDDGWAQTGGADDFPDDSRDGPAAAAEPLPDASAPGERAVHGDARAEAARPDPQAEAADSAFQDTLSALLVDAAKGTGQKADAKEAQTATEGAGADESGQAEAGGPTLSQEVALETEMSGAEEAGPEPEQAEAGEAEPVAARVLRVKRADFEAAKAGGLFEEIAQDAGASRDPDAEADADAEDAVENFFGETDSVLSPEEEADLQRELAELEAEMRIEDETPPPPDAGPEPESEPETAIAKPDRGKLAKVGDEDDLARIFDEADSQMAGAETSKRRNTIQHLRAALAATRAEKEAGVDLGVKVDDSPYRGDLAAVVRPRRPEPGSARSSRPEEPRPAPLKLVAEQRVDTQRPPVRPRRVATPPPEVLASRERGFSEFAEEMGATALPDLLEAAAAYLADVEGRAQFSRPMLMGKLREVDEEGFSREDGLRSFGQLLREGKLQKLSGGRFAVTEETEFRAEARKRAG